MRRLHDIIAASVAEAIEQERTQKMHSSREVWEQIVDRLFQKIEIVYLLDFALDGTMTFFRGSSTHDNQSSRNQRLTISFGKRNVVLKPILSPGGDTFGFVTVSNYPDDGRESLIICSLSEGWMISQTETSLRKFLSRFLPVKYAPITIESFHEMLADLMQEHQPIFTFDAEVVYERFSSMLDKLISVERQRNVQNILSSPLVKDAFSYLKSSSYSLMEKGRDRLSIASIDPVKLLGVNLDKNQG